MQEAGNRMKNLYKLSKTVLLSAIFLNVLFANTPNCLFSINHEKIKNDLKKDGSSLMDNCAKNYPNLFITITNLDDPRNIIAITHEPKTSKGYPLKNITQHAQREERVTGAETILAVNGFTWKGVVEDSWFHPIQTKKDAGFISGGHAVRPAGTVQSKGNILYRRKSNEVIMRFSERTKNGTQASMSVGVNEPVALNADNSSTSIMLNGASSGKSPFKTSSVGIGNYNGKRVLIILSPQGTATVPLTIHYEIFKFFGVNNAMRLDGSSASSLYFKGKHVNSGNGYGRARDIMYALTVSRTKICDDLPHEPVISKNGAIEVTLNWTCSSEINMDLDFIGDKVIQDLKDVESVGLEHAYVASESDIYPGTTYLAKATGEKREESQLEESYLEDNPVNIYAVVKTPGGSKFKQWEAKNFGQLNLKEFATIEVKDNKIETIYSDENNHDNNHDNNHATPVYTPPYVRTYNECDDKDKKYTCQCVPCEYIIRGMDGAVEYGPIGGAEVEVIRADTYGSTSPVVVYRGKTTDDPDLFKSGLVKFSQSDYAKFEEDVYYVVDAKGGSDLDRDDDLVKDATPTVNNGTIHAIIRGSDLKTVAFRVNALTEAIYQTSGDLLGNGYDAVKLDEKLLQASQKLFREKTFIFNNELNINYHDALLWAPGVDKKKLFKPYDTFVEPIVVKTYADAPRVKESYRLIYELLDNDAPQLSPLAVEIPHTIPNGSIIGKITIASEGASGIKEIVLQGEANASFSIDKNGLVKIVDNTGLTIDALYKLKMIAIGNDGKRGIGMELVVKVVEGVPLADPNATVPSLESVTLHDVPENSVGGTVVADTHFADSALSIVSYALSGEDNASFSIDNKGQITVKEGADLDYEKSDTYTVKVSATNEAGNESFPMRLSIKILNEIDTPLHDLVYLVHLSENVPLGTKVGVIEKLREGRSPIDSFDILNPSVPFAIDVNGTIRTTGYIDYESVEEYNLIAMAKTASGNGNKVELQILIDDIYPETGKPTLQAFTGTVNENANAGTEVGALTLNQGASVVERITLRGTGYSNFNVDVNGSITVAEGATLDYEQKSSYALEAIAHNANGSSAWVNVQINLNNLDDETPTLLTLTKYVEENATAHTVIGTLRIASSGEGNITDYTLTGAGSENFSIDENGTIRVSSSANLDYETTRSYTLEATVLSDAGESEPTSVRIYILNVPENPPVLKPLTLNIEENATIGTVLGKVQEDVGGDTPVVSYTLDDNSTFSIDANGTLRVVAPLDYETQTQYTLQVTASNSAGTSEPVSVRVVIGNIPESEPKLLHAQIYFDDTLISGDVLGNIITLEYGDTPIDNMVLTGDGAEDFMIDSQGRITSRKNAENLQSLYRLTVQAFNAAGGSTPVNLIIRRGDHVPPTIQLIGDDYVEVDVNGTYIDQGATAIDNIDGELQVHMDNPIDVHKAGTYIITYSATDSAGNKAIVKRTVFVSKISSKNVLSAIHIPDKIVAMALSGDTNILYLLTGNKLYVIDNTVITSPQIVKTIPLSADNMSKILYDMEKKRIYIASYSGRIMVYDANNASDPTLLESKDIGHNIITLILDKTNHVLYTGSDNGVYRISTDLPLNAVYLNMLPYGAVMEFSEKYNVLYTSAYGYFARYGMQSNTPQLELENYNPEENDIKQMFISESSDRLYVILNYTQGQHNSVKAYKITPTKNLVTIDSFTDYHIGDLCYGGKNTMFSFFYDHGYQKLIMIDVGGDSVDIVGKIKINEGVRLCLISAIGDMVYVVANDNVLHAVNLSLPFDVDTTPPTITLIGDSGVFLMPGEPYFELGATAYDDKDGDVNVTITGTVDEQTSGVYELVYRAEDSVGNVAEVKRIVYVF